MGTGTPRYSSPYDPDTDRTDRSSPPVPFPDYEEPPDEAEVFSQIKRPRVRYDVEVITKLIVYSGKKTFTLGYRSGQRSPFANKPIPGIAALVVEGAPVLFNLVNLGMGRGS